MQANTQEPRPDLKPCPLCGGRPPEDLIDTLYPTGTFWRELKEEGLEGLRHYFRRSDAKPGDGMCWGMHCTRNIGGCGMTVSGDSREEAIAAWNRRPPPKVPKGWLYGTEGNLQWQPYTEKYAMDLANGRYGAPHYPMGKLVP